MELNLETLVVVLAGGEGSRLWPLTMNRTKPAVPIGAKYRLIDIPLSNAANSGLRRCLVLTQGKDKSLNSHIKDTWQSDRRFWATTDTLSPQQIASKYEGDAHAVEVVRQHIAQYDPLPKYVLVVPGDHLLKMDYASFLRYMIDKRAHAAVSLIPRPLDEASQLGSLAIDEQSHVVGFAEKDPFTRYRTLDDPGKFYASMGIYGFRTQALFDALDFEGHSFGRHILPAMVKSGMRVVGYDYAAHNSISERVVTITEMGIEEAEVERADDSGYWEDVGTLPKYFKANMDLIGIQPQFNLYGERWRFFTHITDFGPAKAVSPHGSGGLKSYLVADGAILSGATGHGLVVSPKVLIENSHFEDVIIFGRSWVSNSRLRRTIVDKLVRLDRARVGFDEQEDRARGIFVDKESGIRVVPKGYVSSDRSTWIASDILYR